MSKFERPENPVLNYVSNTEPEKTIVTGDKEVVEKIVYVNVPIQPERKSVRKVLLLYPSVHDKILEMSKEQGTSFNDFANEVLKEYIKNHNNI